VREILIEQVEANPYQPRTRFDEAASASWWIRSSPRAFFSRSLCGDLRRFGFSVGGWRAPTSGGPFGGLEQIPAIVKEVDDREMLELALGGKRPA